jgi:hypothetical protein
MKTSALESILRRNFECAIKLTWEYEAECTWIRRLVGGKWHLADGGNHDVGRSESSNLREIYFEKLAL